jgi:hypothetical protein
MVPLWDIHNCLLGKFLYNKILTAKIIPLKRGEKEKTYVIVIARKRAKKPQSGLLSRSAIDLKV